MIVPPELRRYPCPHHAAIARALGEASFAAPFALPAQHFLFICFANRSGSNYLAHLLAASGACNEAGEFFNATTVLEHSKRLGLPSLAAYVQALPGILGNPALLAAKASFTQLVMLADCGILPAILPRSRFILIERHDRLGQAISRVIASQNDRWTSAQAPRIADHDLVYDRAEITAELARADIGTFGLYRFFAANGLVPVHVEYGDVVADPAAVLADIGVALGLGVLPYRPAGVGIARQAGAVNQAWRARFLAGG